MRTSFKKSYEEARESFRPMSRKKGLKRGGRIKPRRADELSDEERAKRRRSRPLRHARSDKKRRGQEWSKSVKDRDGWKCRWPRGCQTNDNRIDAHHIAERSLRPDLRYDAANGIALCRTHHGWIPLNRAEAIEMGLLSDVTYEAAMKL